MGYRFITIVLDIYDSAEILLGWFAEAASRCDPESFHYCGKTLRRRQVYNKKIQWLCSTYIEKGVKACKGIRIDDAELQELNIAEQTVVEEVIRNGKKYYSYTSKADFDCGIRNSTVSAEIENGSVLPSVNRPRRTPI